MNGGFVRIPGVGLVEVRARKASRPSGAGAASWRNVKQRTCGTDKKARRAEADRPCNEAREKRARTTAKKKLERETLKRTREEEKAAQLERRAACAGKKKDAAKKASCKAAKATAAEAKAKKLRERDELKRTREAERAAALERRATCALKKERRREADAPCLDARQKLRAEAALQRRERELRARKRSPAQLQAGARALERYRETVGREAENVRSSTGSDAAAGYFAGHAGPYFARARKVQAHPYESFAEEWERNENDFHGRVASWWRKRSGRGGAETEQQRLDREQREYWEGQEEPPSFGIEIEPTPIRSGPAGQKDLARIFARAERQAAREARRERAGTARRAKASAPQKLTMAQLTLAAGRNRIALKRLQASKPRPLIVPYKAPWMVLVVHPSTVKAGWWQATTWDLEGPVGDTDAATWAAVLEHAHGYGIDWARAQNARGPAKASPEAEARAWLARKGQRAARQEEHKARLARARAGRQAKIQTVEDARELTHRRAVHRAAVARDASRRHEELIAKHGAHRFTGFDAPTAAAATAAQLIQKARQANLSNVAWLEAKQDRRGVRHERLVAAWGRAQKAHFEQLRALEAIPHRFSAKRRAALAKAVKLGTKAAKLSAQVDASSVGRGRGSVYSRQRAAVGVYVTGEGWRNRPLSPRTGRPMTDGEMALAAGLNPLTASRREWTDVASSPSPAPTMLRIVDLSADAEPPVLTHILDFCRANPALRGQAGRLRKGESFTVGGGAAPEMRVERVS